MARPGREAALTAPPQSMTRGAGHLRHRHAKPRRRLRSSSSATRLRPFVERHGWHSAKRTSSSAARDCNRSRTSAGDATRREERQHRRTGFDGRFRGSGMSAKPGSRHGSNGLARSASHGPAAGKAMRCGA